MDKALDGDIGAKSLGQEVVGAQESVPELLDGAIGVRQRVA